jgi:hypothetical protein
MKRRIFAGDVTGRPRARSLTAALAAGLFVAVALQGTAWAQPVNDTFPGTTISGATGCIEGTNVDATGETDEPTVTGETNSVWYSWTAPGDGTVSFRTYIRSLEDSTLGVYTGAAVNELALVGDDDDSFGLASRVTFEAANGTTYRIRVAGFGNSAGTFALEWGGGCPPPGNDDFADATVITGASGSSTGGTNEAATLETGELNTHDVCTDNDCAPETTSDLGGTSVWYAWTAPDDLDALDVCVTSTDEGLGLDPRIGVYTGSLAGLIEVAYSFNFDSSLCDSIVTFDAVQGTTYMFGVGGEAGSTGVFDLSWGDRRVPVVQISSLRVKGPRVIVTFSATDAHLASVECAIDGGGFNPCTSPVTFELPAGLHTLNVRATDTAGHETTATTSFTIKSKKIKT